MVSSGSACASNKPAPSPVLTAMGLSKDDIEAVVGEKIAQTIVCSREGSVQIQSGGGGVYGKICTLTCP